MTKVKKILVISNMYPGKRSKTYGIFVKNQVEALKERGMIVDVVAIKDPRRGRLFVLLKYLRWVLHTIGIFLTKGKSYDVIHAHYIFPSGFLGLMFKKIFKTRLVVTSHGGDIDQMAKKGNFMKKQTKRILQQADQIIAVGEELKQQMTHQFAIEKEKITVLNMGVDRKVFSPELKKQAKENIGLEQGKFSILFVGNRIRAKGLLDLLFAYHQLKEKYAQLELHIIGSPSDMSFQQELDETIQENKMKDVTFHPALHQKEIAMWMAGADLFVLPSHMEGFGLVALEAMSVHTPVVGTNVGGLAYLLKDDAGVLVAPKNVKQLAEGMEKVMLDLNIRNTLIKCGERKAASNNQNQLIEQLIKLYEPT